jgi:class 3 adenylate cyclase/tetratricopeptide (TPR) repeat protein
VRCPECQAENREGAAFCTECGQALAPVCPGCGATAAADDKFCGACGKPLSATARPVPMATPPPQAIAEKVLEGRAALKGQRRQVTVLFADMEGYTPLAEKLGEEATYGLMQEVFAELVAAVHGHEGTVQEFTGDGIMALFGAPLALEDAPVRACRAALDIQARMEARASEIVAAHEVRPRLRIGLHTGPVVVGEVGSDLRMEFTALGDTVNLASRLETAAEPGTILMSEAMHGLVEGYTEAVAEGQRELKGKEASQEVWRLTAMKAGVTRFDVSLGRGLTRLVGRRREIEALEAAWQGTADGGVHLIDVVGEAGIGKTRLVHEFRQRLGAEVFFLQGNCSADGQGTPYLPFIEIVRTSFRIPADAERREIERRLGRGLDVLGLNAGEMLPYLLNLLGLEVDDATVNERASETVGIRTRDAILAMLRERCRLSSVVLLIDDAHWIDGGSEELILRALDGAEIPRLLLLCTHRPAYPPPWRDASGTTELELVPLSGGSTVDLVKTRLGTDEVPEALAELVTEKAEGNPLFAEELLGYLQDEGRLRGGESGIAFEAGDGGLPVGLENLLMDRVDRLDEGPRAALEAAAVIGRRFPPGLVDRVAGLDGAAAEHLRALEIHELILPAGDGDDYEFKHALLRDAVYESLLSARRAELHGRAAEAIEHTHANRLGEVADVLAHHYSHTERADKAARYLALAGEKSLGVYALEEAETRFQAVLDLLEEHPDAADDSFLADVLLGIARVHYFTVNFGSLIALVEKYLPRIEALGDKRRLSRFLFETGYAHVFAARQDVGQPLLERALALGEEIGDDEAIGYASMGLTWNYIYWTPAGPERRDTVHRLAERAIEIGRRSGDVWLTSKAILAKAQDLMVWGSPGEARRVDLALLELSRETGDPRPRSMGLFRLAYGSALSGEYEEATEYADEALHLSMSPMDRMYAQGGKAFALVLSGHAAEAIELLEELGRRSDKGQMRIVTFLAFHLPYGLALVMSGRMAEGVRYIEDSARRYTDLGQPFADAWAHYYLGEIYLQMALGTERPTLTVILRNLGFVLRTVPVAAAKARRNLAAAAEQFRALDTPGTLAMSLYSLGLLDSAKKRPQEARAHLAEARDLAAAVEAEALVDKIDAALAGLA